MKTISEIYINKETYKPEIKNEKTIPTDRLYCTVQGESEELVMAMCETIAKSMGKTTEKAFFNNIPELKPEKVYVFTDVSYLLLLSNYTGDLENRFLYEKIKRTLSHTQSGCYIIIADTPSNIARFLELSPDFPSIYGGDANVSIGDIKADEFFGNFKEMLSDEARMRISELGISDELLRTKYNEGYSTLHNSTSMYGLQLASLIAFKENASCDRPDDFLGINKEKDSESARVRLEKMVGLTEIKQQINDFERDMIVRKMAKGMGIKESSPRNHMIFSGNPGTGKTEVARIISKVLFEIGVVKKGQLISVTSKDLISEHVGETAIKTAEVLSSAMGGVLLIDEAYALNVSGEGTVTDSYKSDAITEIITCMENHRDDIIIIFAGYGKEMNDFLDGNPGIASRIGYTFSFPDYKPEELSEIAVRKLEGFNYKCDQPSREQFKADLSKLFEEFIYMEHFGNARFASQIVQKIIGNHNERYYKKIQADVTDIKGNSLSIKEIKGMLSDDSIYGKSSSPTGTGFTKKLLKEAISDFSYITEDDIPTVESIKRTLPQTATQASFNIPSDKLLEDMIGLENVKEKIRLIKKRSICEKIAKETGIKISVANRHMLFTGDPGTGKTVTARIIARIFYEAGICKEDKLVEVTQKDLVAHYVGQTASKTAKAMSKAFGGVLFVDEAYQLAANTEDYHGGFNSEAITEMIKIMNDNRDKIVVIFAGYKKEMNDFIESNPGIKSRIGITIDFENYNPHELNLILRKKIEKSGFSVDGEYAFYEKTEEIFSKACTVPRFGNGRFVENFFDKILDNHYAKFYDKNEEEIMTIANKSRFHIDNDSKNDFVDQGIKLLSLDDIPDYELTETAHKIGF